jgi:hypothetical protein
MTTCHKARLRNWLLVLIAAAAIASSAVAVEPDPPLDPGNSLWCLYFKGLMPPKEGQPDRRELNFYLLFRGGRIVHAVASAPYWNKSIHAVDVSKLSCVDNQLAGNIDITFHKDGHVPEDGRPIPSQFSMTAALDRDDPGDEEAIKGSYQGTFGEHEVSGRLIGRVTPADRTSLKAARYWYRVFDVLVGSTDDPRRRDITIELDVINGWPTNARFTPHTTRKADKVTLPLTVNEINLKVDQLTAEYTFLYPVLGDDTAAKASYHLKVDVKRVHDLLGGEFEATVKRPGGPDVVKRGALRGHCDPLRD